MFKPKKEFHSIFISELEITIGPSLRGEGVVSELQYWLTVGRGESRIGENGLCNT